MLMLSYHLATANALTFYCATLPTMFQASGAAALAFSGLLVRSHRTQFILTAVSSTALGLLIIPCLYASYNWPGGDDGGSFGWLIIMGGASLLSVPVALCTCGVGVWLRDRAYRIRSNESESGDT
jgi:hypothetical protein